MANFQNLSRYNNGLVSKNREGKTFLVLRQPLNLAPDAGDVFVTVDKMYANRPDLVASLAYNDPQLWWVIYEFNGIRDPFFDLKVGTILRIPSLERVLAAIDQLGS